MKIRALVPFSTGTITMEKYEIREVSDAVGAKLVAAKLVTEIKDEGEAFVVKMTLTSESGGTMDHTNVEILNAYQAGKAIMFDITLGTIACRVQATLAASFDGVEYPSFNAIAVNTDHQLVNLFVDPYATENNTFTMAVEELGGGSGGGVLVVTDTNGTLDKTWTEIDNAMGAVYIVNGDGEKDIVFSTYEGRGDYHVAVYASYGHKLYVSSSASGYPTFSE